MSHRILPLPSWGGPTDEARFDLDSNNYSADFRLSQAIAICLSEDARADSQAAFRKAATQDR
jgi:hypothetical protein